MSLPRVIKIYVHIYELPECKMFLSMGYKNIKFSWVSLACLIVPFWICFAERKFRFGQRAWPSLKMKKKNKNAVDSYLVCTNLGEYTGITKKY